MSFRRNIPNGRNRSTSTEPSKESELDESLILEERLKRLLTNGNEEKRLRNIFNDIKEVPKLRRSVVTRAVQNVVSSTPRPTETTRNFFCADSLNISPIDPIIEEAKTSDQNGECNENNKESKSENVLQNVLTGEANVPIVISDSDDQGYDSAQNGKKKNSNKVTKNIRYNTRSETRKSIEKHQLENSENICNEEPQNKSNCRTCNFSVKRNKTLQENSLKGAVLKEQEQQNTKESEIQDKNTPNLIVKVSRIPVAESKSKSAEKVHSNKKTVTNSTTVGEEAPPKRPPRKKRSPKKNSPLKKNIVNFRAAQKETNNEDQENDEPAIDKIVQKETYAKTFVETGTSPVTFMPQNITAPCGKHKEKTLVEIGMSPAITSERNGPARELVEAGTSTCNLTKGDVNTDEVAKIERLSQLILRISEKYGNSSKVGDNSVSASHQKTTNVENPTNAVPERKTMNKEVQTSTERVGGSRRTSETSTSSMNVSDFVKELESEKTPSYMLYKTLKRDPAVDFSSSDDDVFEEDFEDVSNPENRPWRVDSSLFPKRNSVSLNFLRSAREIEARRYMEADSELKERETKTNKVQRYTRMTYNNASRTQCIESGKSPSVQSVISDLVNNSNDDCQGDAPASIIAGKDSKTVTDQIEHTKEKNPNTSVTETPNKNKSRRKDNTNVINRNIVKSPLNLRSSDRLRTKAVHRVDNKTLAVPLERKGADKNSSKHKDEERKSGATTNDINRNISKSPSNLRSSDRLRTNTMHREDNERLDVPLERKGVDKNTSKHKDEQRKSAATTNDINRNIFKSPLNSSSDRSRNDNDNEILAVPLEPSPSTSRGGASRASAKKTPRNGTNRSNKKKAQTVSKTDENSMFKTPLPSASSTTKEANDASSNSDVMFKKPVKAKVPKARKKKQLEDDDTVSSAETNSANVTGLRRSGRERRPTPRSAVGFITCIKPTELKYFNQVTTFCEDTPSAKTTQRKTRKQSSTRKSSKNAASDASTAKKNRRENTSRKKTTAKKPRTKTSDNTFSDATDDNEQINRPDCSEPERDTIIISGSDGRTTDGANSTPARKHQSEDRVGVLQDIPKKRSRVAERSAQIDDPITESGEACSLPKIVIFEDVASDTEDRPHNSNSFRSHLPSTGEFSNTNNVLEKDSGRSSTFEESNTRLTRPRTGRISKHYKRKSSVCTKISKVLSRSLNSSNEREIVNTNEPNAVPDDATSRRSSISQFPKVVQSEYINLLINDKIMSLKYIEKVPKFKLVKDNLMVMDGVKNIRDGGTMGLLKLPPSAQKSLHIARKFALFYFVIEGEGVIQVHNRTSTIGKLSMFIIPIGAEYCIINTSKEDPLLLNFVKVSPREIQ